MVEQIFNLISANDCGVFRSQSSSSTEDLSPSHTADSVSAKDTLSLASMPSLSSQMADDQYDDGEMILFDATEWVSYFFMVYISKTAKPVKISSLSYCNLPNSML